MPDWRLRDRPRWSYAGAPPATTSTRDERLAQMAAINKMAQRASYMERLSPEQMGGLLDLVGRNDRIEHRPAIEYGPDREVAGEYSPLTGSTWAADIPAFLHEYVHGYMQDPLERGIRGRYEEMMYGDAAYEMPWTIEGSAMVGADSLLQRLHRNELAGKTATYFREKYLK